MTTKHEVIALHRRFPDWSSTQIAERLGCSSAYVRATFYRNDLTFVRCHRSYRIRERQRAIDLLRELLPEETVARLEAAIMGDPAT